MPLSDRTIARSDDTVRDMQYKLARAMEEFVGDGVNVRVDDPRNLLMYRAVNAARAFLTYLEELNLNNVVLNEVEGKYRFKADGTFQLWNADQLGYQSVIVGGEAGQEYIEFGEVEV